MRLDEAKHISVLGQWADFARERFRKETMTLKALVERSSHALLPLSDPLLVDFGTHRWLAGSREEAYSDWLAWLFERLSAPAILQILGSEALIPFLSGADKRVEREKWIKLDHWDQARKIDLLISLQDVQVLVEVKVTNPENSDIAKNRFYAEWFDERTGFQRNKVLIAVRGGSATDRTGIYGFRLRYWDEVCIEVRRVAKEALGNQQILTAAMALAFGCGSFRTK